MAAAPAPAAQPPLVLDAHADTLDHVVRALAHSDFLEQAVRLLLASPEHLHDPELLYRTRGVRGEYGRTLLMRAVERCDVARAAKILGACPTPATRAELLACVDSGECTALHIACASLTAQGVRMIPWLVAQGAREALDNRAMRALARNPAGGAQPTDGEVVAALNALVSVGSSLTQRDVRGSSPLDWAAKQGNAPVVRALLSLGVPAASSSLAAGVAHPQLLHVLLAAGAPPNALVGWLGGPARSPLMEAARASALESVEALLAAGASVDLRDESGLTALTCSVMDTFNPRVTEALLAAGADVNARGNGGWTVLHWLADERATRPWAAGAARLLLQRGADARAATNTGRTPAQLIPSDHGVKHLRLLLEAAAA